MFFFEIISKKIAFLMIFFWNNIGFVNFEHHYLHKKNETVK